MQYVTDGRRKFVWSPRIDVEQFFDLEQDPGECHDLIDNPKRQDEIARWRGYLVRELAARVRRGAPGRPVFAARRAVVFPVKDVRWRG